MNARNMIVAPLALVFAVALGLTIVMAQTPIKRTIVQKTDVPGTNLEVIVAVVDIEPNFKSGRHTHPGNVVGYVSEGEFFITLDGQSEKQLKVGKLILVPDGAVHDEGTRDKPTKLFAVYVVEKGKPLASPFK